MHIHEMYKPCRELKFWHVLLAEGIQTKRAWCKEAPLGSISVKQLPERLSCKSCFSLPLSLKRRWQMKRMKPPPPSLSTVSGDPRGFLQPNAEWFLASSFVEYYTQQSTTVWYTRQCEKEMKVWEQSSLLTTHLTDNYSLWKCIFVLANMNHMVGMCPPICICGDIHSLNCLKEQGFDDSPSAPTRSCCTSEERRQSRPKF